MNNKIKQEMDKIEIPKELSERSKMGVTQAMKEIKKDRKSFNAKGISIAAVLVLSIGAFTLFNKFIPDSSTDNQGIAIVNQDGSVEIPALQLPDENMTSSASMIGLIVYNGKVYTETRTEIDPDASKDILGEKLGTTKGTIDEWSKQEVYDEEFASTVGIADVYSVKGYDKDFRIMTFEEQNGKIHAEFFENLTGVTINNGKDIFGKLNMEGNISSAHYRTFSDWNNEIDNYQPITDMETLNTFVVELNNTKPIPRGQNSDPISNSRSDEKYRELSIKLNDGSTVRLTLLKEGNIYYGYMGVYFEMDEDVFSKLWSQIQ